MAIRYSISPPVLNIVKFAYEQVQRDIQRHAEFIQTLTPSIQHNVKIAANLLEHSVLIPTAYSETEQPNTKDFPIHVHANEALTPSLEVSEIRGILKQVDHRLEQLALKDQSNRTKPSLKPQLMILLPLYDKRYKISRRMAGLLEQRVPIESFLLAKCINPKLTRNEFRWETKNDHVKQIRNRLRMLKRYYEKVGFTIKFKNNLATIVEIKKHNSFS